MAGEGDPARDEGGGAEMARRRWAAAAAAAAAAGRQCAALERLAGVSGRSAGVRVCRVFRGGCVVVGETGARRFCVSVCVVVIDVCGLVDVAQAARAARRGRQHEHAAWAWLVITLGESCVRLAAGADEGIIVSSPRESFEKSSLQLLCDSPR